MLKVRRNSMSLDTEEKLKIASKLSDELLENCKALRDFASFKVVEVDTKTKEVTVVFEYDDPEGLGNTIFCNY